MHIAGGVVVGIKKVSVLRNFRAIARHPNFHDERLEEPARVREMPFRRAYVGHRLHDVIFRLQTPAQTRAEIADLAESLDQTPGTRGRRRPEIADLSMTAHRPGHEGVCLFQESAFLLELLFPGFEHLIVRGFFDPVGDKMFAEVLLIFHARRTVPGR